MKITTGLLLMLLVVPTNVIAQEVAESFALLNQRQILKEGNTLWVAYTGESGGMIRDARVKFLHLTDSSITVLVDQNELMIVEEDVRRIAREQRGPLWNGLLIGAAVVGGTFTLLFWNFPDDRSDLVPIIAMFTGIGAGIGMGIDALKKEQRIVYQRPGAAAGGLRIEASPLISKDRKGVLFSVRW